MDLFVLDIASDETHVVVEIDGTPMDEPPSKKAHQEPLEDAGSSPQPTGVTQRNISPAHHEPQAGNSADVAEHQEPGPSTSAAAEAEPPPPEDPLFNESLAAFAQRYKLSALNVKNIIYVSAYSFCGV